MVTGIEASIHSIRKTFEKDTSKCMLLVDAKNAFNNLNRTVALHNVIETCPSFHRYLNNSYKAPADLGKFILSKEGATQGDPVAMAMYSVATSPIKRTLSTKLDDSAGCGNLNAIKRWWDAICEIGPKYGYFPQPRQNGPHC